MSKTIIFCLPGKTFSGEFLDSWTNTISNVPRKGYNYAVSRHYSSVVYYARSLCLGADVLRGRHQKPFDGKFKYDYLMWIDSDIVWDPDQIFQLINHDVDIVGGIYKMEGGTQFATVKNWDEKFFLKYGTFQFITDSDIQSMNGLTEVTYNGFGFMLIKYGVFESMEYPWFRPVYYDLGNNIYDFTAEDVGFCKTAIDAGFKIHIDPTVIVKHQKMQLI
jgi:hypothetical protein